MYCHYFYIENQEKVAQHLVGLFMVHKYGHYHVGCGTTRTSSSTSDLELPVKEVSVKEVSQWQVCALYRETDTSIQLY